MECGKLTICSGVVFHFTQQQEGQEEGWQAHRHDPIPRGKEKHWRGWQDKTTGWGYLAEDERGRIRNVIYVRSCSRSVPTWKNYNSAMKSDDLCVQEDFWQYVITYKSPIIVHVFENEFLYIKYVHIMLFMWCTHSWFSFSYYRTWYTPHVLQIQQKF